MADSEKNEAQKSELTQEVVNDSLQNTKSIIETVRLLIQAHYEPGTLVTYFSNALVEQMESVVLHERSVEDLFLEQTKTFFVLQFQKIIDTYGNTDLFNEYFLNVTGVVNKLAWPDDEKVMAHLAKTFPTYFIEEDELAESD